MSRRRAGQREHSNISWARVHVSPVTASNGGSGVELGIVRKGAMKRPTVAFALVSTVIAEVIFARKVSFREAPNSPAGWGG